MLAELVSKLKRASAARFGMTGAIGSVTLAAGVTGLAAHYGQDPFMGRAAALLAVGLLFTAAALYLTGLLNKQLQRTDRSMRAVQEDFQTIGQHITAQRRAEAAERALVRAGRLSAVGHLTALVAHEVNQPLSAILSNAETAGLVLSSSAPSLPTLREIIGDIRRDSRRAITTIGRVQALVRDSDTHVGAVDVNEAIGDILKLMEGDLLSRRVRFVSDLAASLPAAKADRHALQEVLINLIANALDAMKQIPESDRLLTIRTAWNTGEIEVDVADCGLGIDKQHIDQIFDPFFTTKSEGTGLGLSLSQAIIRRHHGRIWANNNRSGGATFRFTLPVDYSNASAITQDSRSASKQTH